MAESCVPVLLGSDINAYGMARSFHERYGIVSEALTSFPLMPTRDSDIVNVTVIPHLDDDSVFLEALRSQARVLRRDDLPLVLIPCGDTYADLVSKYREELAEHYIVTSIDHELLRQLTNKASFYALCDEHGLDHPATAVVTYAQYAASEVPEPTFGFPRAVKPADSVAYLDVDFPGRKKAYVVQTEAEMQDVIRNIYTAGYRAEIIVQDFVPGGDENMRVLNAYVGTDGKTQMMCVGHPLLEDYQPASIGNYTVIMTDQSEDLSDVYAQVRAFLEGIGYVGFANFDMKYDERDGNYRFFELNPRQGRSSYFVTLAGRNLAEVLVRDRLEQHSPELVIGANEMVWLGVPKRVFEQYAADGPAKAKAEGLLRAGRWGSTLWYRNDKRLVRRYRMLKMWARYVVMYRRYFGDRGYHATPSDDSN